MSVLSDSEISRIKVQLRSFDCNERESDIYIQSLLMGPRSVQDLARNLKMNRVTVYSASEQLIEKGLLFETRQGKKRLLVAAEPSVLHQMLQRKMNELNLINNNLDYTIELLSKLKKGDDSKPTVKFYEGVEGFKKMVEETLEAKGEVRIFQSVQFLAAAVDPVYLEDYVRRRAEKGISARLIFPPNNFAEGLERRRKQYKTETRYLAPDDKWSAGFFTWNNKIAFLSFTHGRQTCTILENSDLAYFFQNIVFEMAWEKARPRI